ncbi:MAG: pectinesterase family protein, partial [Bacteroidales bacterium]
TTESGEVVSESESFSYRLNDHTTLKAVFETIPVHQLSIDRTNGAKSYMINLIPAPTFIDGKGYYESGTEVSLQPASNMILTFNHWENGSTDPKRVILMESDMKLTAHYSAASYIAGWDFAISDPKQDRSADFIAETTNAGMFQALSADGTTKSWLAKGEDLYQEGRHAVINWHGANDNVYFQARFSTKNYRNIRIYSKMLSCYFSYKTQKIEWSVDGKNFEALNMLTFDAQKTWYDFNTSLPETANGQDMIFIRWIPDYNAGTLGNTADKDGTSITDIFILADKDLINDEEAPLLISSLPENMATNISANGSIILNFNEQVQPGSANCTLNGESMTGVFNNSTVIFRYNGLEYDSDYTFDIPAGSLKDMSGNLFAGGEIKFRTMVKVQPEPRLFDLVVAADGSGDVKTVKEAIMLAPENSIKPYLIFIKEGIYKEHIEIPLNKPYIHLIGQDPEKVIITDDQLCGGEESVTGKPALHVSQGATVVVNAENFFAENISFENSWGIDKNSGPQALALFTNNDRIILNNCRLRSYQDTYLTSTRKTTDRHYLHNCFIEGAVDFIYGGGDVYFDACTLYIVRKSGGYIVAPSHKTDTKWGYVFMNNTITAPATPSETNIWLGRPWKDAPKTVFLHTKAEVTIPAAGWFDNMGAIPAIFADYNTVDGQGNKVDLSHRIEDYWYWADDSKTQKITGKAKKSLTDNEAASYTIKNVLSGDDQWQPNALIEQTGAPVVRNESGSLTWDAIPFAISYVIFKDDQVVAFSEKNTYKPADQTTATYKVRAVNEAGSLGEESAPIVYIPMGLGETETTEVGITGHNQELIFTKIVRPTTISVYQTNGIIVNRREVTGNTIIPVQKGIYIVRIQSDQHSTSRIVSVF